MTAPQNPPPRLCLAIVSGRYERVHYGLVLAAAAAALNRPVTLFFTMEGTRAVTAPGPDGAPGWHRLRGNGAESAGETDRHHAARGVAGFEELLDACRELGTRFLVCETGLAALDLGLGDLRPDLAIEIAGAVTFLTDADADATTLLI